MNWPPWRRPSTDAHRENVEIVTYTVRILWWTFHLRVTTTHYAPTER
jgi:hypothetical protein